MSSSENEGDEARAADYDASSSSTLFSHCISQESGVASSSTSSSTVEDNTDATVSDEELQEIPQAAGAAGPSAGTSAGPSAGPSAAPDPAYDGSSDTSSSAAVPPITALAHCPIGRCNWKGTVLKARRHLVNVHQCKQWTAGTTIKNLVEDKIDPFTVMPLAEGLFLVHYKYSVGQYKEMDLGRPTKKSLKIYIEHILPLNETSPYDYFITVQKPGVVMKLSGPCVRFKENKPSAAITHSDIKSLMASEVKIEVVLREQP